MNTSCVIVNALASLLLMYYYVLMTGTHFIQSSVSLVDYTDRELVNHLSPAYARQHEKVQHSICYRPTEQEDIDIFVNR